ncbi:histidine--tRNA ligase [Patescibacteria group bacterium]|nr:histidine--tRNA ligase [Patescibacteria group bacterium]MBU1721901.1 histidine--tRNA ligase [Patescibacteria group bacterium]MBU1900867.1 histidine--tRNA ligase [Patescibacteria group bacterium]
MPVKKTTKKATTTKVTKKGSAAKKAVDNKKAKAYESLRGMKDILPKHEGYWLDVFHKSESVARAYGYQYMQAPILEQAQLFVRSIGKGTDVVNKEMYIFEDRDGKKVALRPELTAGIARAYISNGMHNLPQPVKVWYQGPMFRHDRPQAGRYRQFHQFGCEVLGDRDPVIDAELIAVSYNTIKDLGIDAVVHINSIGSLEDRQNYLVELVGYFRSKRSYLSDESKKRVSKNPLRILDSKDGQDLEVIQDAPQIIDWLSQDSKAYFMKVLEYLDELQVPYVLVPTLVRGLDYYTDTVFELFVDSEDALSAQSALGGGGRYDGLVEQLGGRLTPAAGFSLGIERIILAMKDQKQKLGDVPAEKKPHIFFAQLGEQGRRRALSLIEQLRKSGVFVGSHLSKNSLKGQLELANKQHATHTIILGQKEVQDGTVIIRDMDSGIQEIIDQKKLEKKLKKLLEIV